MFGLGTHILQRVVRETLDPVARGNDWHGLVRMAYDLLCDTLGEGENHDCRRWEGPIFMRHSRDLLFADRIEL